MNGIIEYIPYIASFISYLAYKIWSIVVTHSHCSVSIVCYFINIQPFICSCNVYEYLGCVQLGAILHSTSLNIVIPFWLSIYPDTCQIVVYIRLSSHPQRERVLIDLPPHPPPHPCQCLVSSLFM